MKIFYLVGLVSIFFIACGTDTNKQKAENTTPVTSMVADDMSANPVYKKGVDLVAKNQCLTCHKVSEKLTGPSYKEVATKYAGADDATVSKIADKIILGGSGVWGDVPMTPHPALAKDDAKAIVQYILLLK